MMGEQVKPNSAVRPIAAVIGTLAVLAVIPAAFLAFFSIFLFDAPQSAYNGRSRWGSGWLRWRASQARCWRSGLPRGVAGACWALRSCCRSCLLAMSSQFFLLLGGEALLLIATGENESYVFAATCTTAITRQNRQYADDHPRRAVEGRKDRCCRPRSSTCCSNGGRRGRPGMTSAFSVGRFPAAIVISR
jgi:hypothetical protein